MRRKLLVGMVVAIAAPVLVPPAAANAQERVLVEGRPILGEVLRPTPIGVYAGNVAWSSWDPSIRAYRLMLSVDGQPAMPMHVRPRPVPFDIDLGPGPNFAVNAVYSRCRVEPQLERAGHVLPAWNTARGCDLYRLSLPTGDESRIQRISTPHSSEYLPTIWRWRVGFVRRFEGRPGVRGIQPHLYSADMGSMRPSRRIPGGPAGTGRSADTIGQPVAMDRRGERFAHVWNRAEGPALWSELRSVTPGGASERLELAPRQAGLGEILRPTHATSTTVVSGRVRVGARQELSHHTLGRPGAAVRRQIAPSRLLLDVSRDHAVLGHRGTYVLDAPASSVALGAERQCSGGDGRGRCRIIALPGDPFDPAFTGVLPEPAPAQPGQQDRGLLDGVLDLLP
jgi:hypothetical protein